MDIWKYRFFKRHKDDDPTESCPGEEFLKSAPTSVRADLGAIVIAVAAGPPPAFRGGGMWKVMHGAMSGFYEVRTRGPDRRLYRLFCVLERDAAGLDGPTPVIITGMSKRNESAFSDADYDGVRRLAAEYRARTPRSVM